MKQATKLIKSLTNNYTIPLSETYSKIVLQVATLEERIRTFTALGMIEKSDKMNKQLENLIRQIKKDFRNEKDD